MPNFEEHCQHSLKKYGYRGEKIHRFLDKPSRKYGSSHREFRHDSKTVKLCGKMFREFYGSRTMAENIALDHIMLDHEEEIKKRDMQEGELAKKSVPFKEQYPLKYLAIFKNNVDKNNRNDRRKFLRFLLRVGTFILGCLILFPTNILFGLIFSCLVAYFFPFQKIIRDEKTLSLNQIKMLETSNWYEVVKEEEPDFLSEENLESQGIPSSAVMDTEDEE